MIYQNKLINILIEMEMMEQYVCTVCGFNMVGYYPKRCLLCGSTHDYFITSQECSAKYKVRESVINDSVSQLLSVPKLGLEHAAYRIKTLSKTIWIDCPCAFDDSVAPTDYIWFTHQHFLGSSNLYGELFKAGIWINALDAKHPHARRLSFDNLFQGDFEEFGVKAFHVNGHTLGFTIYIFEDVLFVCDYIGFDGSGRAYLNPYGNKIKTPLGALKIQKILEGYELNTVCGVHYVMDYAGWKIAFDQLIETIMW